jgi:hypothetical protein
MVSVRAEFRPEAARAGRQGPEAEEPVAEDDVLEIEFAGGQRLWMRVDDYRRQFAPQAARAGSSPAVLAVPDELPFTAPLTAITAAVVGVILNLAVFFAWHTFWPKATDAAPFAAPFDAFAVAVAIAASVALFRYKVDIMKVIGACALIGLAYTLAVG